MLSEEVSQRSQGVGSILAKGRVILLFTWSTRMSGDTAGSGTLSEKGGMSIEGWRRAISRINQDQVRAYERARGFE